MQTHTMLEKQFQPIDLMTKALKGIMTYEEAIAAIELVDDLDIIDQYNIEASWLRVQKIMAEIDKARNNEQKQ